jgi:hypothetical protein
MCSIFSFMFITNSHNAHKKEFQNGLNHLYRYFDYFYEVIAHMHTHTCTCIYVSSCGLYACI